MPALQRIIDGGGRDHGQMVQLVKQKVLESALRTNPLTGMPPEPELLRLFGASDEAIMDNLMAWAKYTEDLDIDGPPYKLAVGDIKHTTDLSDTINHNLMARHERLQANLKGKVGAALPAIRGGEPPSVIRTNLRGFKNPGVPTSLNHVNMNYEGVVTRERFWSYAGDAFDLKGDRLYAVQKVWDAVASTYKARTGQDWYQDTFAGLRVLSVGADVPPPPHKLAQVVEDIKLSAEKLSAEAKGDTTRVAQIEVQETARAAMRDLADRAEAVATPVEEAVTKVGPSDKAKGGECGL
jgi:hypothetical protein